MSNPDAAAALDDDLALAKAQVVLRTGIVCLVALSAAGFVLLASFKSGVSQTDRVWAICGVLFLLGAALVTMIGARNGLRTRVNREGVVRFGLRGPVRVMWRDVAAIAYSEYSIVLTAADGSVLTIPMAFFANRQRLVDYVDRAVPTAASRAPRPSGQ